MNRSDNHHSFPLATLSPVMRHFLTSCQLRCLGAFFCLPLLVGCTGYGVILAPKNPLTSRGKNAALRTDLYPVNSIKELRDQYDQEEDEARRKRLRGEIIHRLLAETDNNFLIWSQRVFGARIASNTAADVATGVLSTVAVGSGAASAKSIGVAIASIAGVRVATDKNLFIEQNATALYSKMKEQRAMVAIQMEQYLAQDTTKYPLNKALRDVERYYEAGTLGAASARLAGETNQQALIAEAYQEDKKGDKVVAPALLASAGGSSLLPTRMRAREASPDEIAARVVAATKADAAATIVEPIKVAAANADTELRKKSKNLDFGKVITAGGGQIGEGTGKYKAEKSGLAAFLKNRVFTEDELKKMKEEIEKQRNQP